MKATEQLQMMNVAQRVQTERGKIARSSLRAFAKLYMPHCLVKENSQLHEDLYDLLDTLPDKPGARISIAAPRGSAKSTLMSLIYALWVICHEFSRYIVLLSDTGDKAADFLGHIKDELTTNERLAKDYPKACEPSGRHPRPPRWRHNEIITRNGVKVTALGVGQSIRGRRHRQDRPDLIILDDVENQENTTTEENRRKVADWFHKDVLKAGTPRTKVVIAGTIQHYDSLLAKLTDPVKSPLWKGRVYKSVISWSDHPGLWEEWTQILRGQETFNNDEHGAEAARAFFEHNETTMLEGTQVLWPALEDYYTLMLMRESEGPASFDSEKQNEPVNPKDCLFLLDEFHYWDDKYEDEQALIASIEGKCTYIGACDPSLGKAGKRADDSAIITLLRDNDRGTLYVLDADVARRKPDRILEDILNYARLRKYASFGIESNQFQSFLADELDRRSKESGVYLSVKRINHTSDKLGRIQSLQPLVRSGTLQFSRRHKILLEQLRLFPKASHDDAPDTLEMAVATSREYSAWVPFEFESAGRLTFEEEGAWWW